MHGDLPANSDTEGGRTDRSYIGKLPTLVFSAGKRMDDQEKVKRHSHGGEEMKKRVEHYNTCAVCLSEYEEDELLKRLPACSHLFHKECIDMWLFSHSTCPLCRLSLFNHKGDLILHNGKEATHLEHASTTSTPARPSSLLARCRSSYEQSSTLGLHNINISGNDDRIQRSTSHPVRRDNNNNNRVHPIG
ncbi:hypothetical protein L7F22_003339 [Adiantum nelumboides]|nr:hypothetical protein [Adiantum nelumboides]